MKNITAVLKYKKRFLALSAGILCTAFTASAGNVPLGIGVKTTLAGNGLSAATAITAQYSTRHWAFELGADVQMRVPHFSGVQGTLYYYPMNTNAQGLRLAFYTTLHYNYSAFMNRSVIAQEKFLSPEKDINFETMTMSTVEAQSGFLLRVNHGDHVASFYGIGFGAYHTLGSREAYPLVHRDFDHYQLVLNIGLTFSFGKI